jgi:hypothetical protein
MILCFIALIYNQLYSQNDFRSDDLFLTDDAIWEKVSRSVDEQRTKKQKEIKDYNNLPGSFWIRDKTVLSQSELPSLSNGYIFLPCNSLLIVDILYYDNLNYQIGRINLYVQYEIIDNEIIILDNLFCYLENGVLFFGNKDMGFNKYMLQDTFSY